MPPALEVDAAACAAACEAAPEYARQFEQLPRELAEARAALFSGDLMADMLRGAHRSLPAATDQRFNVEVLAGLLRAKATVAPRPAPGGGTVALSWDNVVFVPCDFSAEQTLADMGTYGGTLSARATIWRTPSGGGPPAGRCLGDMDIAFLHLMVGSSLDPRSDPRFENPHLPAGAFVVNGHPRAMASSLGLPALHAPLVFAPPASRKSTSAMMRFCNSRERCTLLLQGEAGRRVAVIAQGRRSAPAGAVLAALLGDDADEDAVEDLVRGASVGDRRLWAFLYEVVLAPLASDWRAEEGGRRRARERWNADSPSWPAPDIRAELLPGLGDARLPQLELLLRRLAIAEVYAAYDARDHPANLYACTPGTALAALAEERFEELGRALASWLSSDRAADEDSARTRVAALVKRVVIKKWHNRNWTGTWGMHRSLTQQLELLSPIMSAALVHTFRRRGGEKSLDPRGPRGADQVLFGICPSDTHEGPNVGNVLQRQAGAFHTLSRLFWSADGSEMPPAVRAALAPYLRPWTPDARRRADEVLVLLSTEDVHTRWVGTVPGAQAEAAFRAAEAAALDFAAEAAADEARGDEDWQAAAAVTVALRRDPQVGKRGTVVAASASAAAPVCLRVAQGGGRLVRYAMVVPPGARGGGGAALAAAFPARASLRAAVAARAVRALDANSAANAVIAGDIGELWESPREPYTHAEVHASLRNSLRIMSMACAGSNPTNRVATSAAQHGQKPSFAAWPGPHVPHNPGYLLLSGSAKYLATRADSLLAAKYLAIGQGMRVAIAPWDGDSREDCCQLNAAASGGGYLSSLAVRTAHAEPAIVMHTHAEAAAAASANAAAAEAVANGWDDRPVKTFLPEGSRLQADGAPPVGARVPPAGGRSTRVLAYPSAAGGRHPNASMEDARVHAVLAAVGAGVDRSIVTVVSTQVRYPEDGDKTSNNHGCKAVFKLLAAWLFACLPDGSQPVAMWNPQTLSQRCVYGFLLEVVRAALLSASTAHLPDQAKDRVAALRALVCNGAAFEGDLSAATAALAAELGLGAAAGRADLVDPRNGARTAARAGPRPPGARYTDSMVAVGFLHASLLRQYATEKVNVRGNGPDQTYNVLNDQPTAGRAKFGGGTRGEMEFDALVAHGVMLALWHGDGLSSDGAVCLVCPGCGYFAASEEPCARCASRGASPATPVYTQVAGSFRLLQYVLRGIGVDLLLRLAPE